MQEDNDIIVFIENEDLDSFIKYYNPNKARSRWKCPKKFCGWKTPVNLVLSKKFKDPNKQIKMLEHMVLKNKERSSGCHSWMDDYIPGSSNHDLPLLHFIRKNIKSRKNNKQLKKNFDHYLRMINILITYSSRNSIKKSFFYVEYESRMIGSNIKSELLIIANLIKDRIISGDYCESIDDSKEFRYDQLENLFDYIMRKNTLEDFSRLIRSGYINEINIYLKSNTSQEAQKLILPYLL